MGITEALKRIFPVLILLASIASSFAQEPDHPFESICFCKTRAQSPDNIVNLDNNQQILNSLQAPASFSELRDKERVTQSQLELLKEWKLIVEKEGKFEATVPVLDSSRTEALRRISLVNATRISGMIREYVSGLKQYLAGINLEKNTFSILFSYILDGSVWLELEKENLLKARQLSDENELWNGEFWLLQKRRDFFCGTNKIKYGSYGMYINWNLPSISKMKDFFANWGAFEKLFDDYRTHQKVINDTALAVFSKYRIFDDSGAFSIPVIRENQEDNIYLISLQIAKAVAGYLRDEISYKSIPFHFRDHQQAIVVIYHEILWDLMDIFNNEGLINRPLLFSDPEGAVYKDAADLIFLTRQ